MGIFGSVRVIEMGIKIIAVDIDGVLCKGQCFTKSEVTTAFPIKDNIGKVNELAKRNFVVLYTARRDELIPGTLKWLKRQDVRYHAISNQKTSADYYIDDRAITFEELLEDETSPYQMSAIREAESRVKEEDSSERA